MKKTRIVHCKRSKYDVYIGRPGPFGNPFIRGKDGTKEEVIEKYRKWITASAERLEALKPLQGKILACWCAPNACHGHVIKQLLEEGEKR
jgi:hypothetical protein